MIKKIISGGQTGADQAALDVAIQMDIPHGGWVPKGRLTENGPLPEKYRMDEMPTANYQERTEQNVIDSDGTLILSHGKLSGGSAYTRDMALVHARPWLHVDLNRTSQFEAARKISLWLSENSVEILNVAGPRASRDPNIYDTVVKILKSAYMLALGDENPKPALNIPVSKEDPAPGDNTVPTTVANAVDRLLEAMSFREKTTVANMTESQLPALKSSLSQTIRNRLALWCVSTDLMKSCMQICGKNTLSRGEASLVILRQLWSALKQTHAMRVVK